MQKKLYVRVDMNQFIATGHVMRCLSIAQEAKTQGVQVKFILADTQAEQFIKSKGFQTKVLYSTWNEMEKELPILLAYIVEERVQKLLVDSYYVTENYLSVLKKVTEVSYIDDLGSNYYPVDILIVYANYWKRINYRENYSQTTLLLGCKYVPLRKEFAELPQKKIRENIESLLILTGGTDNYGISERILEHLSLKDYKNIDVICGRYDKHFDYLKEKYGVYTNVKIYQAVDNIVDYIVQADVAISAGGTTLYELCAAGTPTITYSFADNQLDNVRQFAEDGIMEYAGDIRRDDVYSEIAHILEKYTDGCYREIVARKEQDLVDGRGAWRLVKELMFNNKNM